MKAGGLGLEIVVVDDDDDGRLLTGLYLRSFFPHARVSAFSCAEDALLAMKTRRPHAIVTDYRLPAMNGMDFTKVVRTQDPDVPIIMLSGMDSAAAEALAAGVNAFLRLATAKELGNVLRRFI